MRKMPALTFTKVKTQSTVKGCSHLMPTILWGFPSYQAPFPHLSEYAWFWCTQHINHGAQCCRISVMQSISVFERWRRAVVTGTQSLSTHCTLAPVDSPHLPLHSVQYTQSILNTIHTLHSPSHHIIYPFTPPHHPSHLPPSILTSTSSNLLTNKPFLFHAPHKNHSVAIAAAIYKNDRQNVNLIDI